MGGLCAGLLVACTGAPPQITNLSPANGAGGVVGDAPIVVTFDHPVDRASVAASLSISPGVPGCPLADAFGAGPAAPCRLTWSRDDTVLTLDHHGAPFAPDTKYRVHLAAGLRDRAGVVNGLDHSWELTTGGAPALRSTSPPDGAPSVPLDSQMLLELSAAMDPARTLAALEMTPAVPGTTVRVNAQDPTRVVISPGRLLAPSTAYTVTLHTGATDVHGQRLRTPVAVHFTTGTALSERAHALVLAGTPGEPSTAVLLTATQAAAAGDPVAAVSLITSARCQGPGACGPVAPGAPLEAWTAAVPRPGGGTAAVLRRDLTAPGHGDELLLLDTVTGNLGAPLAQEVRGVAWSPDGRTLAWTTANGVDVIAVGAGDTVALPAGSAGVGPPAWSGDSAHLAIGTVDGAGRRGVDLVEPGLGARYPAPGAPSDVEDPVLGPDGTALAASAGSGLWLVGLRTVDAAPRALGSGSGLRPVGFLDAATLLAVRPPAASAPGALLRVTLAGDQDPITSTLTASAVRTAVAAPRLGLVTYVSADAAGTPQAWVVATDGSAPLAVTAFAPGVEARSVSAA